MLPRQAAARVPLLRALERSFFPPDSSHLPFHRTLCFSSRPRRAAAAPKEHSSNRYYVPQFQRDARFKQLDGEDVDFFRGVVGEGGVLTDEKEVAPYNLDWMGIYKGECPLVLKPRTVGETQRVLKYCNDQRIAVVPQGGNTGLVGGSVPTFDEVVLSLANLNKIISFDESTGVLHCQAGCVLESLYQHVEERGFTMPIDLGAKGSCHIGGNVSTNAGGLRYLRYGPLSGSVLGLEVVKADGTRVDMTSLLRKDNTGYKAHQLFIGAEGTLGVVTAVTMICPFKSSSVQLCLFQCDSFDKVVQAATECRRRMSDIISAVEFFDRSALEMVTTHIPGSRDPFQSASPFYLLVETSGQDEACDYARVEKLVGKLIEDETVTDGVYAENATQIQEFWKLRESIGPAMGHAGKVYKYDITLPLTGMYHIVELLKERLKGIPGHTCVGYGHLGDSNLHINVLAEDLSACQQLEAALEPFIWDYIKSVKGSVSAEHGLGVMKADKITAANEMAHVELMRELKRLLDPNGILNPYKVMR
ncbi:unnamed protein product [Vitrella brassicaformis CCMP3155]|uniref:FAD-binding PCMH-type domain-containing protein n=3 Tax=Vitrella brassicaformis TaxID=1169539 RepID=A0A0G4ERA2_VITBC|nr:unnamed protein product [Vitrella brassicaformis CCMP3155]|eukprot:CEL99801.1 unnamed protein product [Vitrella brassicaformis CCMP3155]